jgi:hypothetical protein
VDFSKKLVGLAALDSPAHSVSRRRRRPVTIAQRFHRWVPRPANASIVPSGRLTLTIPFRRRDRISAWGWPFSRLRFDRNCGRLTIGNCPNSRGRRLRSSIERASAMKLGLSPRAVNGCPPGNGRATPGAPTRKRLAVGAHTTSRDRDLAYPEKASAWRPHASAAEPSRREPNGFRCRQVTMKCVGLSYPPLTRRP